MNSLMNTSSQSGNNTNIIGQFIQFRQQLGNKNPQEMIQELVSSGKLSQEQLSRLQAQAKQLEPLLKGFLK